MHASFSTAVFCCALAPLLLLATLCPPAAPSPVSLDSPTPCCFSYSGKRIPQSYVASYYKTSSQCPLPSVVFTTHKGRKVCTNPAETWVRDYVKSLQQAKEQPRATRRRRELLLQQLLK